MNYRKILKSAMITEKSNKLAEVSNKYTFEVVKESTKDQIKKAVESLYDVTVKKVNVLNTGQKTKRSMVGKRNLYVKSPIRKAIVELKEGDSLKVFEGS